MILQQCSKRIPGCISCRISITVIKFSAAGQALQMRFGSWYRAFAAVDSCIDASFLLRQLIFCRAQPDFSSAAIFFDPTPVVSLLPDVRFRSSL